LAANAAEERPPPERRLQADPLLRAVLRVALERVLTGAEIVVDEQLRSAGLRRGRHREDEGAILCEEARRVEQRQERQYCENRVFHERPSLSLRPATKG